MGQPGVLERVPRQKSRATRTSDRARRREYRCEGPTGFGLPGFARASSVSRAWEDRLPAAFRGEDREAAARRGSFFHVLLLWLHLLHGHHSLALATCHD